MIELLTEAEAAKRLRMSARTLRRIRLGGKIRYIQPTPRKIFYHPDDLAQFIAAHAKENACLSTSRKARTSGTLISSSRVIPFTALEHRHDRKK